MNTDHLALVAGDGILPIEILKAIKESGAALPQVYLLSPDTAPYDALGIEYSHITNFLAVAMILTKMKLRGIKRLIMAGAVPKKDMYDRQGRDEGAQEIFDGLKDRNDHSLLAGIVAYIEKFGIKVVTYDDAVPEMLAGEGHIAGPAPTDEQLDDCEYGLGILRVTLPMSFGQSVAVSARAVVAVEAMEGTDRMIKRVGTLSHRGSVIKGMRADQDRRYDIPVVGPVTLRSMAASGLTALFIEAGSTLILERASFIEEAGRLGISVEGVPSCRFS